MPVLTPNRFFGVAFFAVLALAAGCTETAGPDAILPPAQANITEASLSRFTLNSRPATTGEGRVLTLLHVGQGIYSGRDEARTVRAAPPISNFPQPGCTTQVINLFTGGANCCNGYYLLSTCLDGDFAAYIPPYDGSIAEPMAVGELSPGITAMALPVSDGSFMYYGPSGSGDFWLSRVESPQPRRYLVFDKGVWRADRPGEFRRQYETLIPDIGKHDDWRPEVRVIVRTYYRLMAGTTLQAAEEAFRDEWPADRAGLATKVFADIRDAVNHFGPVVNIAVR